MESGHTGTAIAGPPRWGGRRAGSTLRWRQGILVSDGSRNTAVTIGIAARPDRERTVAAIGIGIRAAAARHSADGAGKVHPAGAQAPALESEAGRLVASADLENALYARLASMPVDSGPLIGLTFRDKSGAVCRTFQDQSASGLACREGGDWRIRSLFQASKGQTTDYRMASGQDPQLMEAVETSMDGEPFDAAQEKAAMDKGWR